MKYIFYVLSWILCSKINLINESFKLDDSFGYIANYNTHFTLFMRFKVLNCNNYCNSNKFLKIGNNYLEEDLSNNEIYLVKLFVNGSGDCEYFFNKWKKNLNEAVNNCQVEAGNENIWKFFIINDEKNIELNIDTLTLIDGDVINETFDYFNDLPLTFLLIDFYNNHPNSKYLLNEIHEGYTWNYSGIIEKEENSYELLSNWENSNPNWFSINNIGNFEINDLLVHQLNELLIKNFCIAFNFDFKIENLDTNWNKKINLLEFENNHKIFLKLEKSNNNLIIIFYFKNEKFLKLTINNINSTHIINLKFSQFILNFKHKLDNLKIKIFPIIKIDYKVFVKEEIDVDFNKFEIKKIIIGGQKKELSENPWFKIKFKEFQIIKGILKNDNNNYYYYSSYDINNIFIYNFKNGINKLDRNYNFNECSYNCYNLYSNDNNSSYKILTLKKKEANTNKYDEIKINELKKIDLKITYNTNSNYFIYLNIIDKIFEINGLNKKISYSFFTNKNFNLELKFISNNLSSSENLNIKYKINSFDSNDRFNNYLDCSKYNSDYLMENKVNHYYTIINTNYKNNYKPSKTGICVDKNSYKKNMRYFNKELKSIDYCYKYCLECSIDDHTIKCKKSDSDIEYKTYYYNKYYQDYFIYNQKIIFFKNKSNQVDTVYDKDYYKYNEVIDIYDDFTIIKCDKGFDYVKMNCFDREFEKNSDICYLGYYLKSNNCINCKNNLLQDLIKPNKENINLENLNFYKCNECNENEFYDYYKRKCLNKNNCVQLDYDSNCKDSIKNYIKLKEDYDEIQNCNLKCLKCKDTFYADEDNCIKCQMNYCKLCDKNKCFECIENYDFDPLDNRCSDGILNKIPTLECKDYFYKLGNKCKLCFKNCLKCENISSCNMCKKHFKYNIYINTCELNEGCPDENCTNCLDKYYKDENNNCEKCMDNCLECSNKNECIKCIDYHKEPYCEINEGCSNKNCTECIWNYTLIKEGICKKCFKNCEFCNSDLKCIKCKTNFVNLFYNCKNHTNCISESKIQCKNCNGNYLLKNGFCKKTQNIWSFDDNNKNLIKKCINHFILVNNNCIDKQKYFKYDKIDNHYFGCKDIYYEINYNNKKICIKNDIRIINYVDGNKINLWKINYFNLIQNSNETIHLQKNRILLNDNCLISINNFICLKCKKGYLLNNNNKCDKIITWRCKLYENNTQCKECYNNFYLSKFFNCNKKIDSKNCIDFNFQYCNKCNLDSFLDGNNCYKCNKNLKYCDKCLNKNNCIKCNIKIKNIYHDKQNNLCKICKFPCLQVIDLKIKKCFDGYFLKNDECKKCRIDFCKQCFNNICIKCETGFYFRNNVCYKCPNNCIECNIYKCLKAKIGYYLEFNKLNKCSNNCLICSSRSICLKCKNNFFWDFLNNKCINKKNNCKIYNNNNSCLVCKEGYFKEYSTNLCKKCDRNCNNCLVFKNNCIDCKKNYIFLKQIILDKIIGKCYLDCEENQIFDIDKKLCFSCGINDWEIYHKYYLKLYFSKHLIFNKKNIIEILKNKIKIINLDNYNIINFKIIEIKENYFYLKLDLNYIKRIIYLYWTVDKEIFNKNNCVEQKYENQIKGIDFEFVKKKENRSIELLDSNSKEFKYIKKYGKMLEKISIYVSIILLITSLFFLELSNILSKLFNTFQLISYISILNINYDPISNTIFYIVNTNLSVILDISQFINITKKNQSNFSNDIYYRNIKIKNVYQRFFSNVELNIIIILIGFFIRLILKLIEKIYKFIINEPLFIIYNYKEKDNKLKLKNNRFIKVYNSKNIVFKKMKLNNFEKIKFLIKNFQMTIIMSESPNMFLFIFNFYKSFNLIDFKNIYHYIIIINLIIYNYLIYYFLKNTIKYTKKLKKYSLYQIYKSKLNYLVNYLYIIGDYSYSSSHTYLWVLEFIRNFFISFNLIYMNKYLLFQIFSILLIQIIYTIIIFFYSIKNNFELKRLKIQEISILYLFILIFLIKYSSNNKNKENYNHSFIGTCIAIFLFNIFIVIYEIALLIYSRIKKLCK